MSFRTVSKCLSVHLGLNVCFTKKIETTTKPPIPRAGLGLLPPKHMSSITQGAAEGLGQQPGSVEAAAKPGKDWGDVTEGRTRVMSWSSIVPP